jgi:hypothetical protein
MAKGKRTKGQTTIYKTYTFPKCTMDSSLLLLTGMWGIKFTPNIKMHLQVLLLLCLVPNVSRVSGLSIFDCPFSKKI